MNDIIIARLKYFRVERDAIRNNEAKAQYTIKHAGLIVKGLKKNMTIKELDIICGEYAVDICFCIYSLDALVDKTHRKEILATPSYMWARRGIKL